jgi:hypothetical protein
VDNGDDIGKDRKNGKETIGGDDKKNWNRETMERMDDTDKTLM